MTTIPTVCLRKELARSIRRGHPWIYRDALERSPDLVEGALVTVAGRDRRPLAWGFWDTSSPIAVRLLDTQPVHDPGALVRGRLDAALAARLARLDRTATDAFRWVHGEGDRLPGIHVDLYGDTAVARADGAGARAFYGDLRELLTEIAAPVVRLGTVIDREGRLEAAASGTVIENGLRFHVDLARGQKGGLFLDQRENRAEVGRRAAGRSVLNLFGYTGAFSLYAASGGATRTDTVDLARPAIEAARDNFALNGLAGEAHGFHAADAFAFLETAAARGQRWDVVICDPPSFAPSERALPAARRAYRRLHRMAATVLSAGGLFCPASCSSHIDRSQFLASVEEGVAAAGRRFNLEKLNGAGFDHPVLPAFPEGDYLKFALGTVD